MKFDLKDLRERKKMSQAELATALMREWSVMYPEEENSFNADKVARMEKNTNKIPGDELDVIAQVFGVTPNQLLRFKPIRLSVPEIKNNWVRIKGMKEQVDAYIEGNASESATEDYDKMLEQLDELMSRGTRKPRIACVGRPDSGKSRTLNTLLGSDILPANWTPTTSSIILLKHMDDKPAYMGTDNVIIFREGEEQWSPDMVYDETVISDDKCVKGSYELIEHYGAHHAGEEGDSVGAVVVFADSSLLYNCDFIDLPGFNPELVMEKGENATVDDVNYKDCRDTILSERAMRMADGFIYLSIANSFLYGDDLAMLQSIVKSLPCIEKKGENEIHPFGNLFVIASQAANVDDGDEKALDAICANGAERLWKLVGEHPSISKREEEYQTGYSYSEETLRSRFFTSEMKSQKLTERFYLELARFIEELPFVQEKRLAEELSQFCYVHAAVFEESIAHCEMFLEDLQMMLAKLKQLEENEGQRTKDFENRKNNVTDTIYTMKSECAKECSRFYSNIISAENIKNVIDRNNFKKNKKDLEELITILNASLENKLTNLLSDKSKKFKYEMDDFIKAAEFSFTNGETFSATSHIPFSFNAGRAFAAGLSGVVTYGALAAWAAACGNLGGYILIAKGVSLLASIGIHVGGTAAAVSAISALGGPAVLAVMLATIAALTTVLALGGTWKKVIGNKLVQQYNRQNVLDELIKASDEFWKETLEAFRKGSANIEAEWQKQMKDFKAKIDNYDEAALRKEMEDARRNADFVRGIAKAAKK